MPIAKLFVEGTLDVQVLSPILLGSPTLQQGGSKYALRPRAGTERRENRVSAGYLRDRDFDFDPPTDVSTPTVDCLDGVVPFGWRWCRHELEDYLIDPAVVSEAMNWPASDYEQALYHAAKAIRDYEAARWSVGIVRRAIPPRYELRTRPDGLSEVDLPPALDRASVNAWALGCIGEYRASITGATDPESVQASLNGFASRFDDSFVADANKVLLWFSGKDLLAALAGWLLGKGILNAGEFRASLRDWIIANPSRALELLPEWKGMIDLVRA